MISIRLKSLLEENRIAFEVVPHDPAFTAQTLAARIHVPGKEFVKAVVVRLDGQYAIAAVPAHRLVDERALARVAGATRCALATEAEFRDLFPDCEVGAMPPVGSLYGLPTYVDEEVTRDESITANAGTHAEAIRLRYLDLARVVQPTVGRFGVPPPTEQPRRPTVRKTRPSPPNAPPAVAKRPESARTAGSRKKPGQKKAGPSKSKKKATGRKRSVGRKKGRARKAVRKPARKKTARGKKKASKKKTARRRTVPGKSRHR